MATDTTEILAHIIRNTIDTLVPNLLYLPTPVQKLNSVECYDTTVVLSRQWRLFCSAVVISIVRVTIPEQFAFQLGIPIIYKNWDP